MTKLTLEIPDNLAEACYTPSEAEVFPVPFVEFKDANLKPEQLTEKSDRASI